MVTSRGNGAKQRILHTAAAILLADGPDALRVDAVAAGAAINKRMIYHYFGNRAGLLAAADEAIWRVVGDALRGVPAARQTLRDLAMARGWSLHASASDVPFSAPLDALAWSVLSGLRTELASRAGTEPGASALLTALVALAFPGAARAEVVSVELPVRKPRVRMTPVTRVRD